MASKKKVEKKIGSMYKINPEKPLGENIFSSSLLEETVGRIVVDLDGGCLRKTKTLIEGSLSAAIDENKINEDGKIVLLPHHLQEIDDDEIRIGF